MTRPRAPRSGVSPEAVLILLSAAACALLLGAGLVLTVGVLT